MPYNEHAVVGKMKGKFTRMKVERKIQKIIKATKGKQGRRASSENDKSEVSFTILFFFYI